MSVKQSIAFFDFDGTVTHSDSFLLFLKYFKGKRGFYLGFLILSPFLFLFFIRVIKDYQFKEIVCRFFFKNRSVSEIDKVAGCFFKEILPRIFKKDALQRIKWHHHQGHEVVLVSASFDVWLKYFAREYQMGLISSRLEIKNNMYTGKLHGLNCKGMEKVRRIREQYNLSDYKEIFSYGDSSGDREMLGIADQEFYKFFKG